MLRWAAAAPPPPAPPPPPPSPLTCEACQLQMHTDMLLAQRSGATFQDDVMFICCLQAALPKAELRRSTRAATRAAQRQHLADQPLALPSQILPSQTPEDTPTATPMPDSKHQNVAGPQGSQPATASDADLQSVQAGAPQTSLEDSGAMVQPPSTAEQAHGAAHAERAASQDASAAPDPDTQLALTGQL